MPTTRDYYKVLELSQSGCGKTFSNRNMNPLTTGFINVENKPLPFKNNFKYHKRPETYIEVLSTMVEYSKNPEITCIVIDSFSAYLDLLLAEARRTKKGFEIWGFYNEEIGRFFTYVKKCQKEVFVSGHYEILGIEGNMEKRCKVKGKEWEGLCEKEFTIVLYGERRFNEKGKPEYSYNLVEDGSSAKCPPDIFGEEIQKVPNDNNLIFEKILDFVK